MISHSQKAMGTFWSLNSTLNSTFSGGNEKGQRCSALAHRTASRREVESRSSSLESSEARQKFAGAKAISSDMFFGREVDSEVSGVVYLATA